MCVNSLWLLLVVCFIICNFAKQKGNGSVIGVPTKPKSESVKKLTTNILQPHIMKTTSFAFVICVIAFASCTHKQDDIPLDYTQDTGPRVELNLRTAETGFVPERFIGRGFNLVTHRREDRDGISRYPVLDMQKIKNGTPWNPWKEDVDLSDADAPQILVDNEEPGIFKGSDVETVTNSYNTDSLRISLDGKFKNVTFNVKYQKNDRYASKSHIYRSFKYLTRYRVSLDAGEKDCQHYIRRNFFNDLSDLSAADLVKKYGTHLVTAYDLGPFSDCVIFARSSIFSEQEGLDIASSVFGATLDVHTANKAKTNSKDITIYYTQGGSDYYPKNLKNSSGVFKFGEMPGIEIDKFYAQVRPGDNPFISLDKSTKLIAIPDLIPDMCLKVKYACGILHVANPGKEIQYVICNPESFEPIKLFGEFVYFTATAFETADVFVYYGNEINRFSLSAIGQGSSDSSLWMLHIYPNGKATFTHKTGGYLTRDFKLLRAAEPTEQCFFAINPIVPREGFDDHFSWGNIMIKK